MWHYSHADILFEQKLSCWAGHLFKVHFYVMFQICMFATSIEHLPLMLILSNEMQHKAVYLLFCRFTLHVSGVNYTQHQEYTKL